ncbi:class II aldolase/adducin family protein [Dactylosporangium sp. CA-092794]|uniref:class II aldolase/adducin family protein n=1 Tax=Dactylosporangium sp. CA-092794 TaxID=3239929 RepID=UPI003D94FBA6
MNDHLRPADDDDAIDLVVQGSHALAAAGQTDMIWGHCSVRDPRGRGAWMKSSGWGFEEIDQARVVLVAPDGAILGGRGSRHIEYPIHTELMRRDQSVGAVVHTHSAAANAICALDVPLRPLDHAGCLFGYPDPPRFTLTGGLIRDASLGRALADTIAGAPACLIPQHGLVTTGSDLPTAVMTAVLLDQACRTQLTAMAAGALTRWGGREATLAKRAEVWTPQSIRGGWDYLLRTGIDG